MKLQKFPILAVAILLGLSVSGMARGGGGGGGGHGGGGGGGAHFGGGGGRSFGGAHFSGGGRSFGRVGIAGGPRGYFGGVGRVGFPGRPGFGRPGCHYPGRFNRGGFNNVVVYGGGGYPYYYGGYQYPYYNTNPAPAVYPDTTAYPNPVAAAPNPEYVGSYNPSPARVNGDLVANVQRVLKSKGFYRGPIDGISGPTTRAAIRAYDSAAGLAVTGMIDPPLLNSLQLL